MSTSFTSGTDVGLEIGTSFGVTAEIASFKNSVKVSIHQSFTVGKSKAATGSYSIGTNCRATIPAGTRAQTRATYLSGTLMAKFTAEVVTHYTCPQKELHKSPTEAVITITNVPTESTIGSCKLESLDCSRKLSVDSSNAADNSTASVLV